jgi:hypothetical protein
VRKPAIAAAAIPVLLLLGTFALVAIRTQHSLTATRTQVASEATLPFDLRTLTPLDNPGFESLATPSSYTTAATIAGKLYLAGPAGLAEFSTPGAAPRLLRTGLDLPPAPIVRLATATLRGESRPTLLAATQGEGLLLYDGTTLRQLRPRLAANRDLTALLPLSSGDILLGTRQSGVLLFNGTTLTPFQPALSNLAITALAGDDGDLWIGTRNQGLLHWHGGQLDTIDSTSGLPDQQVESIALAAHHVFVGTPLGVAQFDGLDPAHPTRILAAGLFAHALAADTSTLTIATIDQGIHELDLTGQHLPRRIPANTIAAQSLIRTSSGLLAVTSTGLESRESSGAWQPVFISAAAPLADSNVAALSFAPDGRLWVGYFDRGLDILSLAANPSDTRAQHVEDDHIFCVNRILPDPIRRTVDVATANGLVLFDPLGHQRQVLLRRDGLIADQVTDIAFTRNGTALATPSGLTFIDPSGMHSLYAFHGLVNNHVYALASDAGHSTLLAGTLGGISLLNVSEQQTGIIRRNLTTANSGLRQNWITAIVPTVDPDSPTDAPPSYFIGTYGAGVMQLDSTGHILPLDVATRSSEINPNAMLSTPQHIFAGSLGDGLLVYSRATGRWTIVTAGLPSLNVTALAQRDGQLFVGTQNGIVHIAEGRFP